MTDTIADIAHKIILNAHSCPATFNHVCKTCGKILITGELPGTGKFYLKRGRLFLNHPMGTLPVSIGESVFENGWTIGEQIVTHKFSGHCVKPTPPKKCYRCLEESSNMYCEDCIQYTAVGVSDLPPWAIGTCIYCGCRSLDTTCVRCRDEPTINSLGFFFI